MDSFQSMASSSSSTVPKSAEVKSHFISQTEMEMESSKARHWSQLDYSTTHSEWSAETNYKYFDLLKEDPQWARFFTDFETLEVGEKISEGAQADIYEARLTPGGTFDLVVKVMKGDAPLQAFQAQWPIGMLSARSKYKHLFDLPLITILGGTVLRDQRLRGRFAFVMYRRWGDLRLLIDRRMKQKHSACGPFPIDETILLMLSIAEDMDMLHNKHDIIHRDLKASNVLVWGEFGEDMSVVAAPDRVARIGSVVADFECSVGVLGTGFWRAPEILEQLKDRVPSAEVRFSRESDVYSYGMTCYEIVTGCIPYDGLEGEDTISHILQGGRPELPCELPGFVRNIIVGCWHSDPSERPTFSAICDALKLKRGPNPVGVVIDNKSERGASIVKVC